MTNEPYRTLHPTEEQQLEDKLLEERMSALRRLWQHAQGHTGQCRRTARFLLGLYNGGRFPFDLTEFRCLDDVLFRDCLKVLELDSRPTAEVHVLLGVPGREFERLADDWRVVDYRALVRDQLPTT